MRLTDTRANLRVKDNVDVRWRVQGSEFQGTGRVANLSTSGLLLEARKNFSPSAGHIFKIDSVLEGKDDFLPHEGRLVWSRPKSQDRVLCGLEFIEPDETVISKLRERIQKRIIAATNSRRIRSWIGTILFIIMFLMVAFIVKQQNLVYLGLEDATRMMMTAADQQASLTRNYMTLYHQTLDNLTKVTKELDSTKLVLSQTQDILTQTKKENADLQNQIALLNAQGTPVPQYTPSPHQAELENQVALLNEKNNQLNNELGQIKEQLRSLEGDVSSLEEGKSMITLFKTRLKLVKTKMNYLKREAQFARVSAQKERDRILTLEGNQGYLWKNGEKTAQQPDKKINIDVSVNQ